MIGKEALQRQPQRCSLQLSGNHSSAAYSMISTILDVVEDLVY